MTVTFSGILGVGRLGAFALGRASAPSTPVLTPRALSGVFGQGMLGAFVFGFAQGTIVPVVRMYFVDAYSISISHHPAYQVSISRHVSYPILIDGTFVKD